MRARHKSSFSSFLPSYSSSSSFISKTRISTPVGNIRLVYLLSLLFLLSSSFLLYSYLHRRPPIMPWVDFQYSFSYKPTLLKQGVKEVCDNVVWQKGVYMDCFARMGTFNALNFLQTCIRQAMDAGVGLVRPRIFTRDISNLSILNASLVSLDYLLDEEFLWKSLEVSCPQMKVVEPSIMKKARIIETDGIFKPGFFTSINQFNNFIHDDLAINNYSSSPPSIPIIIKNKYSLLQWTVDADTYSFQSGYRQMFHLHSRFLNLSFKLLEKLPYDFIGIHLRVESDFIPLDNIEEELLELLDDASMENPIIYLASGEVNRTILFKKLAGKRGAKVVDKWNLADEETKEEMKKMDFDQIALVDYIILHHSQYFKGSGLSSYSYSLVASRYFYQFGSLVFNPEKYVMGRQSQLTRWINAQFKDTLW